MNTNSVEKLNLEENSLNLYKTFSWMEKNFSKALESAIQEFWNMGFDFKLISVSKNNNFFFYGTEYFVTRIKLTQEKQFIVRISKEAVSILLDTVLGNNPNFEFEKITELEAKILTEFNNLIYTKFSEYFLPQDNVNNFENDCTLAFLVNFGFDVPVKILITIPSAFLNYQEVFPTKDAFGLGDFSNTKTDVNLYIGGTSIPLSDIKNLEKEDIIVLENSNINNMILKFEEKEIGFKVSPEPSLIVSFDNDNGSKTMSNSTNIWDNIQVDISAEFEKVKISLGEIKQISEGLVVDMGSIYDNKINLKVENRVIAKGELVIINDRYGVKIDEVCENEQETQINNDAPFEPAEENEIVQNETNNIDENMQEEPNNENSEFDYKDFDVDDENI